MNTEKSKSLEAADNFDKKRKRKKKKRTLYNYLDREEEACRNNKIKSFTGFDEEYVSSIKFLAIKKEAKVNLTTRFLNKKMLMFSKTSIQSFVYGLIDVFMFPDEEIKKFYKSCKIQKCFLFQNVADTSRTSVFFVFSCNLSCSINEEKSRDIIFQVLTKSKILERLDISDDFWETVGVKKESSRKQIHLYEIENINANVLTIAINPKEYFEKYKDFSVNKKHKSVKKILQEWILKHIQID